MFCHFFIFQELYWYTIWQIRNPLRISTAGRWRLWTRIPLQQESSSQTGKYTCVVLVFFSQHEDLHTLFKMPHTELWLKLFATQLPIIFFSPPAVTMTESSLQRTQCLCCWLAPSLTRSQRTNAMKSWPERRSCLKTSTQRRSIWCVNFINPKRFWPLAPFCMTSIDWLNSKHRSVLQKCSAAHSVLLVQTML